MLSTFLLSPHSYEPLTGWGLGILLQRSRLPIPGEGGRKGKKMREEEGERGRRKVEKEQGVEEQEAKKRRNGGRAGTNQE